MSVPAAPTFDAALPAGVSVSCSTQPGCFSGDYVDVTYRGRPEALLQLPFITADMLTARRPGARPGGRRRDRDGREFQRRARRGGLEVEITYYWWGAPQELDRWPGASLTAARAAWAAEQVRLKGPVRAARTSAAGGAMIFQRTKLKLPAPHDRVKLQVRGDSSREYVYVDYSGAREDLIAAGVATEGVLQRRPKNRTPRLDSAGDHYRLKVTWTTKANAAGERAIIERYSITYIKSPLRARLLPGVTALLELADREVEERQKREQREAELEAKFNALEPGRQAQVIAEMRRLTAEAVRRSTIRLVVDNTRHDA